MNEKLARAKQHVSDNKEIYITGAVCIVVGAAAATIVCNRDKVKIITDSFNFKWQSPVTNNLTITLEARGHLGFPVKCNQTGAIFASQGHAASELGLNPGNLSRHLNGYIPHVQGMTFSRIPMADAA